MSLFYKHFDQPIEKVIVPDSYGSYTPSYTFDNATKGAVNYGVEFELERSFVLLQNISETFH